MTHLVTGVFDDKARAHACLKALKAAGYERDLSVISKDTKTGAVSLYEVKSGETEEKDEAMGGKIGGIAGVLGGLSTILNPALASPPIVVTFATAMGVVGVALGEAMGGFIGDLHHADFTQEHLAAMKRDVEKGHACLAVQSEDENDEPIVTILKKHGAAHIHKVG